RRDRRQRRRRHHGDIQRDDGAVKHQHVDVRAARCRRCAGASVCGRWRRNTNRHAHANVTARLRYDLHSDDKRGRHRCAESVRKHDDDELQLVVHDSSNTMRGRKLLAARVAISRHADEAPSGAANGAALSLIDATVRLTSIVNGSPVAFTKETTGGIENVMFSVAAGSYQATYML